MLPELTPATLLAIYGALLSTLLAVWTVRKDFRDRGRLTLRVDIETPIYISETGPERRPKKINFTVINRGRRACTLYRVGFVSRPTLYGEILRRMFRRNWKRRLAGTDTLAWQSFDGLPMRLEYEEFWTGSCDWKAIYMHPYGKGSRSTQKTPWAGASSQNGTRSTSSRIRSSRMRRSSPMRS